VMQGSLHITSLLHDSSAPITKASLQLLLTVLANVQTLKLLCCQVDMAIARKDKVDIDDKNTPCSPTSLACCKPPPARRSRSGTPCRARA
jgi:hypothetical protein